MMRTFIITLLVLSQFIISTSFAANYFVDKDATGNNDGSSWNNAWPNFADINWSNISPGDTIFISGGATSKVYHDYLNIQASGTIQTPIVVTRGNTLGHNGEPILDGQMSISKAVSIDGYNHIVVSKLRIRDYNNYMIDIDGAEGLIIEDNDIRVTTHGGINIKTSTNCIIRGNRMTTPENTSAQTDGIYSQDNDGNIYEYNYIEITNTNSSPHCDGMQFYRDDNNIVRYNWTFQNNSKTSNAQGIYIENCGGHWDIYGNIVDQGNTTSNGLTFGYNTGSSESVNIFNNTLRGNQTYSLLYVRDISDPVIKNNILSSSYNSYIWRLLDWNGTHSNISNNLFYNSSNGEGGKFVNFNGSTFDMGDWINEGFAEDFSANPLFVDESNKDFKLQVSSPGIDNGTDLGAPYDLDIIGTARPQGQAWDIGAYEIQTGPDITPPELQGAIINNSTHVTLFFSESLDSQSAQNESNYTIDNGINVFSAILNSNNKNVTLTTSEHTPNQSYTVTVSNVTDLAGNIISSQSNSAQYFFETDVTPPEVVGAQLVDYSTLTVSFNEQLENSSATNISNYDISNGIEVISANLSQNQMSVELTTSVHIEGQSYEVVVSNVKDLAGNVVSSEANSAQYDAAFNQGDLIQLEIIAAKASSTDDPNYHAGLTIDGLGYYDDPDSRWATIPMPEYLIFDVGSPKIISETRFSFYGWSFGRIYTYTVLTSNDSTNWNEILTNVQSVLEEWSVESFTPVEARFIKLLFVTSNQSSQNQEWAHLWEAELWGPEQPTSVESEDDVVTSYKLHQNYPNPFNPSTKISFTLPVDSNVRVAVYNLLGEEVAELANSKFTSGNHIINFDSAGYTSGVYFYRLETNEFVETKKMILAK